MFILLPFNSGSYSLFGGAYKVSNNFRMISKIIKGVNMLRQLSRIVVVIAAISLLSVSIEAMSIDGMKLCKAVEQHNFKELIELLKNGADPNARDQENRTPLHAAGLEQDEEIVEILLANGARPNEKGYRSETPLHNAASFGCSYIVKKLLVAGAYLSIENKDNYTPVALAREDIVKKCLAKGAIMSMRVLDNYETTRRARNQEVLQVMRDSLRVKEKNLDKSQRVLAAYMRARMLQMQRKEQLMANGAGAYIKQ